MTDRVTLRDFWPPPDAVAACAPPEAEALADAALLAVHQPVRLSRRASEAPADERAVLDELLTADPPGGCVLVLVSGPGGIGKSHLLRWLGLHVTGNRHVVRVPKGASRPHVLEHILGKLEGPAYDAIREQRKVPGGPAELDEDAAVEDLLTRFRVVLERRTAEARAACDAAMKRDGKVDPQQRMTAEIHGPGLVALLDGPTKDVLLRDAPDQPSVFRALARGVTAAEFEPGHFEFPTVPTNKLTDQKLQRYVQKLKTNTQSERAIAAALLNAVRDEVASRPAAVAQPADPFRRVREELQKEGKELVLLFDGFTADDEGRAPLDSLASEGARDGEPGLCVLRAVLAAEEFPSDALAAGAGSEFVLRERPADATELLETMVDTVGAYLNAARLGSERLDAWFAMSSGPDAEPPSFDASADLSDEDRDAIAYFGTSRRGHSLFPFNRAAIKQLAAQRLAPDGELLLNPRKLIADVLCATLLPHRDAFARGEFPPEDFHGFDLASLGAEVLPWLKHQRPEEYARYAVLLGYWGDRPQHPDEVNLPAAVYAVFGLAPLSAVELVPTPAAVPEVAEAPPTEEPAQPEPAAEPTTEPEPVPAAAPDWASELPALVEQSQLFAGREAPGLDLAAVREALDAYRTAISAAWVGWVRSRAPRIDDVELVPFEADPDYRPLVEQIRKGLEELRQAEQKPAAAAVNFAEVETAAARVREALAKLPTDAPAEVKEFLTAAATPAGAPLSALTPVVVGWLEAKGQSEKYRVRR
ncbi:MAG: hypothetical protein J0I06_11935 [Planctomycetes bacterium]|nr:hypothetical protein [Planctomycetota bacterium]